ncbi:unnamed protein product [Closterium sp. NIES-65]|nr:unnamed protein product [Closterium sp. NIES-65]
MEDDSYIPLGTPPIRKLPSGAARHGGRSAGVPRKRRRILNPAHVDVVASPGASPERRPFESDTPTRNATDALIKSAPGASVRNAPGASRGEGFFSAEQTGTGLFSGRRVLFPGGEFDGAGRGNGGSEVGTEGKGTEGVAGKNASGEVVGAMAGLAVYRRLAFGDERAEGREGSRTTLKADGEAERESEQEEKAGEGKSDKAVEEDEREVEEEVEEDELELEIVYAEEGEGRKQREEGGEEDVRGESKGDGEEKGREKEVRTRKDKLKVSGDPGISRVTAAVIPAVSAAVAAAAVADSAVTRFSSSNNADGDDLFRWNRIHRGSTGPGGRGSGSSGPKTRGEVLAAMVGVQMPRQQGVRSMAPDMEGRITAAAAAAGGVRSGRAGVSPIQFLEIAQLFDALELSCRLLRARKLLCSFQAIKDAVQDVTKRRFTQRHLAQMLFVGGGGGGAGGGGGDGGAGVKGEGVKEKEDGGKEGKEGRGGGVGGSGGGNRGGDGDEKKISLSPLALSKTALSKSDALSRASARQAVLGVPLLRVESVLLPEKNSSPVKFSGAAGRAARFGRSVWDLKIILESEGEGKGDDGESDLSAAADNGSGGVGGIAGGELASGIAGGTGMAAGMAGGMAGGMAIGTGMVGGRVRSEEGEERGGRGGRGARVRSEEGEMLWRKREFRARLGRLARAMGAVGTDKDVTAADVTIPEETLPDPLSPSPASALESRASVNAHATHSSHTRSTHPVSRRSLFPDASTNPTFAEAGLGLAPTAAPFARPVLQSRPISPTHRHRPASADRVGRNPNPDLGARVRVDLTPSLDRLARRTNVGGLAGAAEDGSEQARAARQLLFGGTAEVARVSGGASGAAGAAGVAGVAEIARKGVEEGEKEVWGGDVVGELEPLQQQGVGEGGEQVGAVGRGGGDSDGEGGGSDSEILSRLPQGLVHSVRKREEQQRAEATDEARQAQRRRLLLAELPLLTDMVVALFASCRAAVLPHRDLVVRLVANHSKQTNQEEIEEQLKILEEIAPDWLCAKMSLRGEKLYRLSKVVMAAHVKARVKDEQKLDPEQHQHAPSRRSMHGASELSQSEAAASSADLQTCQTPQLQQQSKTDTMTERSYVMIKPDGVQRGLVGEIIGRFERKGFVLRGLKLFQCPKELAEEHYKDLADKPFYKGLVDYIISGPVVAMAWEGKGVVASARKLIGATNPLASEPGTIRGDLAVEVGRNVVHGSDSVENGEREIGLWFKEAELIKWDPTLLPWLRE